MDVIILIATMLLGVVNGSMFKVFSGDAVQNTTDNLWFQFATSVVCALSMLLIIGGSLQLSGTTVRLGTLMGFSQLACAMSFLVTVQHGALGISALIRNSLGMLISALAGPIAFGESVSTVQVIGMVLILAAMFLMSEVDHVDKADLVWLIAILISALAYGAQGVLQKIHSLTPFASEQHGFVLMNYVSGIVFSGILLLVFLFRGSRETVHFRLKGKTLWQFLLFCFSVVFVNSTSIYLVAKFPTVVLFPVINMGSTLLTALVGVLLYKEKMSFRQIAGFLLGLAAMALVSGIF